MADRNRIAVYGHKSIPSREGGVEVVVQELATRLARDGFRVTCMNRSGDHRAFRKPDDRVENGFYRGVRILTVPTIDKAGLAAASSSFFAALRSAAGPYDIVHIHAEGPCVFCAVPKLFGKKVVVTVHGLDWQRDKWGRFARSYIRFGEKMAARHADALIVLSRSMQDYFAAAYGRSSHYIPNGTEPAVPAEADEITRRFGLVRDGYMLYLGRLVPEKRADLLIRAFRPLRTDKKLVIAGPFSETDEYCRKLKALAGDDRRILFTGFVNGRPLRELYSNAYVYTLPSKLEGMPLTLLEAMSYGCCCVTSDIPECREVIGSAGFLTDPDDEEQLRAVLGRLADDPLLAASAGEKALELIRTRCSWDEVASQTGRLYRQLVSPE